MPTHLSESFDFLRVKLTRIIGEGRQDLGKNVQPRSPAYPGCGYNGMQDAQAMKAEYEAKLKEVDKEVEAILADARKRALAREEQIIEEAKTEAAHIIERAHNEVLLEKKGAADDMKKEMIALASALAGKVVSASIDTDIQASLVDETLREMGDDTWQN